MNTTSRDGWLVLSMAPGLGPTLTRRCLQALGSAPRVLEAGVGELAAVEGIGTVKAQQIRRGMDQLADGKALAREKELIEQYGVTALTVEDAEYPRLLRHIGDPPPVLYVRGQLQEGDALALAVVGSRRCSHYGREQADRFAALCSTAGLTIVSGGALGVDAAAHRAALRVKGRTIAVLGSGLANAYPPDNLALFDAIAAGQGAVVSELPMSTPPLAENFPSRNRIISGLSLGVLVVEAALRSGALITARLAAEDHGREVVAVPGRVDSATSAGCHKMIREGWATLVTNPADVLDALGEAGQLLKAGLMQEPGPEQQRGPAQSTPNLFEQSMTASQRTILEALSEPMELDRLAAATGLPIATLQADLTMLQLRGLVKREGGKIRQTNRRSGLTAPHEA